MGYILLNNKKIDNSYAKKRRWKKKSDSNPNRNKTLTTYKKQLEFK